MTAYANKATGNWNDSTTWGVLEAGTWQTVLSFQETNDVALTKNSWVATGTFSTSATDKSVDALLLKFARREASASGTVSVRIYDVTGAAVVAGSTISVNTSDLPYSGNSLVSSPTWINFEFSSPVTLPGAGANTYRIEINHVASAGTGTVYFKGRTAPISGWSFALRLNRSGVPASGDQVLISGAYINGAALTSRTVTHNSNVTTGLSTTGTAAIEVSNGGTLTTDKTGGTNYSLTLNGNLVANYGGVIEFGTQAAPVPSSSTLTVLLNCTSAGQFGLNARTHSTVTFYGATKTPWTYLASSVAASGTSLTTAVSTGWKSGDVIGIASTSRTATQSETANLAADASGTTVTLSAGLSAAHDGSSVATNVRAEIVNLTRNVKFHGASATNVATITITGQVSWTMGYAEIYRISVASTQSAGGSGINDPSISWTGTVLRDNTNTGLSVSGAYSASFSDCVFFVTGTSAAVIFFNLTTTATFSNSCAICSNASSSGPGFNVANLSSKTVSFTSSSVIGFSTGIQTAPPQTTLSHTFTDVEVRCCSSRGIFVDGGGSFTGKEGSVHVFERLNARRNTIGISFNRCMGGIFRNSNFVGNATSGINLQSCARLRFESCTIGAESAYSTTYGVLINPSVGSVEADFESCTFGSPAAEGTAAVYAVDLNSYVSSARVNFRNCGGTAHSRVSQGPRGHETALLSFTNQNNVVGDNRLYKRGGYSATDSTYTALSGSAGERLFPTIAAGTNEIPIRTNPKQVPIPSGKKARIAVSLRRSTAGDGQAYTGTVQLIMSRNWQGGQLTDYLVLATSSGSAGTWERLTADTPTVTADCIAEIYLLAYGVASPSGSFITADYWTAEIV